MSLFGIRDIDGLVVDQLDIPALIQLSQTNRYYRMLIQADRGYLEAKIVSLRHSQWKHRLEHAAGLGYRKVFWWALSHLSLNANLLAQVSRSGQLPFVQEVMAQYPADFSIPKAFEVACLHDHPSLAQYFLACDPGLQPDEDAFAVAATRRIFKTAKWLYEYCHLPPGALLDKLLECCIRENQLELAQWVLRENPGADVTRYTDMSSYCYVQTNETWVWLFQQGYFPQGKPFYVRHCLRNNQLVELNRFLDDHPFPYIPDSSEKYHFTQALAHQQVEMAHTLWRMGPAYFRDSLDLTITEARLARTMSGKEWMVDLYNSK